MKIEGQRNNARGFTLVEMMVVIGIIAILALVAVPMITRSDTPRKRVQAAAEELAYTFRICSLNAVAMRKSVYVAFYQSATATCSPISKYAPLVDLNNNFGKPASIGLLTATTENLDETAALKIDRNDTCSGGRCLYVDMVRKHRVLFGVTPSAVTANTNPNWANLPGYTSGQFAVTTAFTYVVRFRDVNNLAYSTWLGFYPSGMSGFGRVFVRARFRDMPLPIDSTTCQPSSWPSNVADDGYLACVALTRLGKVKTFTWMNSQTHPVYGATNTKYHWFER